MQGIFGNVTLNGTVLTNWSIYSLDFDRVMPLLLKKRTKYPYINKQKVKDDAPFQVPSFYVGTLPDLAVINPPQDTFLRTTGWTKVCSYDLIGCTILYYLSSW